MLFFVFKIVFLAFHFYSIVLKVLIPHRLRNKTMEKGPFPRMVWEALCPAVAAVRSALTHLFSAGKLGSRPDFEAGLQAGPPNSPALV